MKFAKRGLFFLFSNFARKKPAIITRKNIKVSEFIENGLRKKEIEQLGTFVFFIDLLLS